MIVEMGGCTFSQSGYSIFSKSISFVGGLAGYALGGPLLAVTELIGGFVAGKASEKIADECCSKSKKKTL